MNLRRFYITLPSNALMSLYPNNTAAQHTIKLPRPITLDGGDWEVALTELSVPAIFDNVIGESCFVSLIGPEDTNNNPDMKFIGPEGHYSVDSMVRKLRNMLIFRYVSLDMDHDKVVLHNNSGYRAYLSISLNNKLGFIDMPPLGFKKGRQVAEKIGDMTDEIVLTLYVYCDILEHIIVGDVMAPLLRIVEMKRRRSYGNMHETLCSPLYVPLQKKHFDTIEINIMTDTGKPDHFAIGKTVTVLEFKRLGLFDQVV